MGKLSWPLFLFVCFCCLPHSYIGVMKNKLVTQIRFSHRAFFFKFFSITFCVACIQYFINCLKSIASKEYVIGQRRQEEQHESNTDAKKSQDKRKHCQDNIHDLFQKFLTFLDWWNSNNPKHFLQLMQHLYHPAFFFLWKSYEGDLPPQTGKHMVHWNHVDYICDHRLI